MILNSVFLSPIVSFYFILCILFYSFLFFFIWNFGHKNWIYWETNETIRDRFKWHAAGVFVCLVANGDTNPQPMRGGTTWRSSSVLFNCSSVLCGCFPFCLIAERRSRRRTCRGRAEDFVLFGNRLFTRICYLYYLLPFSDLLKTIHSGNVWLAHVLFWHAHGSIRSAWPFASNYSFR